MARTFGSRDLREPWEMPPAPPRRERLLGPFKVVAWSVVAFLLYKLAEETSWIAVGSFLIAFAALLPGYLWCSGRVKGSPIFPLFTLTYLWTYAYPMVSGHPIVALYSDEAALAACATVAACLLVGTITWYLILRTPYRVPARLREMRAGQGDYLFCGIIVLAAILTVSVVGQWLELVAGVFSILRAALFGLCAVGIFALSYRMGLGELRGTKKLVFMSCLLVYVISQMATLFLVSAIVATILAMVGYVVGSRRIPWVWALLFIATFVTLHAGKGEMRDRYWYPEPQAVQPWEYPNLFAEWIAEGVRTMELPAADNVSQPLYERVSLVHLLLKVQDESPESVPYLKGETYAVVPGLLIPRIFDPDKLTAHEGTTILSVHYGLQTRGDTFTTTIGWGLLNEAIANFGSAGIVLFGVVTGLLYGFVTRATADAPILSLRMLVAITFMAFAVQTEFTAGVYVSALFQSLVSLFVLSFFFMDRTRTRPSGDAAP